MFGISTIKIWQEFGIYFAKYEYISIITKFIRVWRNLYEE